MLEPRLEQPPIDEIVRRIVAALHPRRIILFGSRARGEARSYSDIDLFVEIDDDCGMSPLRRAQVVHGLFPRRLWSLDVVVYTSDEIEKFQTWKGTILTVVQDEGRLLYERKAA